MRRGAMPFGVERWGVKMIDTLKGVQTSATRLIGGVFETGATVFAPLSIPERGRRKAA
jgi:hypothetical protein